MFIYNYIINSRVFKFLPLFVTNYILKKIVYFTKSNEKILINNYKIEKKNLNDLKKVHNKKEIHNTCPYLTNILNLIFKGKNFNFFDFGCGNLDLYFDIQNNINNVNYIAYDQDKILNAIESVIKKENLKNISICKHFDENYIDFLYFGSSFQYVENIEKILNKYPKLYNAKYIFLTGIIAYTGNLEEKFIVNQHNMNGNKRLLYFFNIKYLKKIFVNFEYEIIFKKKNYSDKYMNFKNFEKLEIDYFDFLFKKK